MEKSSRKWIGLALLVLALGVFQAPKTAAQQPTPAAAAQEGFVPVGDAPAKEQLPAAPLVLTAYGVVWAAVFVYIWSVWQRLSRVEREMAEISRRIQGARR